MSLLVKVLPALQDNYNFVLVDTESSEAAVVDPSAAQPSSDYLTAHSLNLRQIFLTHHHWDHIGGVESLKEQWGCRVLGSTYDEHRLPSLDTTLKEGDSVCVGSHQGEVLHLPGHTLGHIAYWWPQSKVIMVGDVLFSMGCGRLFEGSAKMMWASLQKIMSLPDDTKIYCAHEYTLTNAQFALQVEPENKELIKRIQECKELRRKDRATIPTTLAQEKATNPFLRASHLEEFTRLRQEKDHF